MEGDRIGFQLDLDVGSLHFYRNGVRCRPAFAQGVTGPLVRAVELQNEGDSVMAVPCATVEPEICLLVMSWNAPGDQRGFDAPGGDIMHVPMRSSIREIIQATARKFEESEQVTAVHFELGLDRIGAGEEWLIKEWESCRLSRESRLDELGIVDGSRLHLRLSPGKELGFDF